jgi:hypothetical protein
LLLVEISNDSATATQKATATRNPRFQCHNRSVKHTIVNNTNALFLHQDQQHCAKHQCQLIKQQRQKS